MAMAGLAFTCLKRSHFNPDQRNRMTLAIRKVQEKILKAQTPEGHFGNVYSTPLALQVGGPPWWLVGVGWSGTGGPGFSPLADPPPPSLPDSVTSCW